jgi:hypothetical protein
MHLERMADDYAIACPPYPQALSDTLRARRVIGPGTRVPPG